MRFVLAALCLVCLLTAFLTKSPLILGIVLFGAVLFAFMAVFAFAQARIEASQQRESYVPSPQEREVMRVAAEKRRRAAAAAGGGRSDDADRDGDGED